MRFGLVFVPLLLAALALAHPTWAGGSVAAAVGVAGAWWIPLHVVLLLGFGALGWLWWLGRWASRFALGAFVLCNSVFLAIDGIAVGVLASTDPGGADGLWNSLGVELLGNVTGALWAAALLNTAWALHPRHSRGRAIVIGLAISWLTFIAGGYAPYASAASRLAALATGSYAIYQAGSRLLPFALLVFAAVLRQHVGAEAALGLLCIAVAFAQRLRATAPRG
jgi:hypothetical protein